ncbi:hypothetical protein [Gimesia panareensis]|uniref:hypothetical protein n=1 Tax=Gimesia panareensis TaxID=2527978 RepID=UPI00118CC86C|nr:hypothetical protein [Gimesia panareensis]QDU48076.1 hypothetical protein Pan110_03880 [Gimesia panareensis]
MNLLRLTFVLPFLLATPFVSAQETDAEPPQMEVTRQAYYAAIDDARAEVFAALDKKMQAARRAGDLKSLERITAEKNRFIKKGTFPASINETTLNHKISLALLKLKNEFKDAIKEAVKQGNRETAARLRKELKSFEDAPWQRSSWGFADYKVLSGAEDWQPFANKARAYTNRGYVWIDIPPACPLKQFTPVVGGKNTPLQIHVTSPGWVFIAFSQGNQDQVQAYLARHAWQPTPYTFAYNADGGTSMRIFRKQLTAGEYEIPRINFSGPFLVKP